jgi:hypothetical protein
MKLITQKIIPTISRVREELPLKLSLEGGILDCTILRQSDQMFDAMEMK